MSCRPSSGVDSSASARGSKRRPTTDARSRSSSCCRGSWSRRAASTASIVGGIDSSPGAPCVATAASCSRNRGFPSATATIRSRTAAGAPRPARSTCASPSESGASSIVSLPAGPAAQLEQLRTAEPHDRHRRVRHERREVVHEIVERRLGPVRVLNDEDERLRPRVHLHEAAYGPEDLVRGERGSRQAASRFQPLGEELLVLLARQSTGDRPRARRRSGGSPRGAGRSSRRTPRICRRGRSRVPRARRRARARAGTSRLRRSRRPSSRRRDARSRRARPPGGAGRARRARPTSGLSRRRAIPGASRSTVRTRQARTTSRFPFAVTSATRPSVAAG